MALVHREPVLGWASWNAVKRQNERADTVEKSAAKEHEASVWYIFRGTFFAAALINRGCFMVRSETYITYLVLNTMHREVCSRAGWLMCLSPTEKFKKELADASRVANWLIFQQIGSLILTVSRQIIRKIHVNMSCCVQQLMGRGRQQSLSKMLLLCVLLPLMIREVCFQWPARGTVVTARWRRFIYCLHVTTEATALLAHFGTPVLTTESSRTLVFSKRIPCFFWIQCFNFKDTVFQ